MFKLTPLAGALALACVHSHAADAAAPPAAAASAPASAATDAGTAPTPTRSGPPGTPTQLQRVDIVGQRRRLDDARSSLSPETGSTVTRFDQADIQKLPLGDATPLNQVLLRAPGVVADTDGQVHVRGDHANLQYRINGVVIPEAISGFGQALDTRFAEQVNVLTGALPAQYGYRTAGVVDIHTKGEDLANAGDIELVTGTRGHREASGSIGGSTGNLQYFLTGSLLQNDIGIENPTPASNALHDETRQRKGFGYLSYLLGERSRVSLMFGSAVSQFQIPNVPDQAPQYTLAGTPAPASASLNSNEHERNTFEVLTFQSDLDEVTNFQVSLFNRSSSTHYDPDPVGDLVYTGVAADVQRRNVASGLQADISRKLNPMHTLRAGLFLQRERSTVDNASTVFPADAEGNPTSDVPLTIADDGRLAGHLIGVYLQDEWQPTSAWTINYGLRYDHTTTVSDESQWSPRLGAVYQLGPDTRVHLGYARYFTPPPTEKIDTTSVALFQGTTNALPSDANTAVRAERSNYFDAGFSQQLTPALTLGLDGYYREVAHLQDEGQFGRALVYSAFNYDQGRIYGLELSLSYKERQLSGYANLGVQSAKGKGIETGQFNFDPDELAYIQSHWVHLDHDQTVTASAGASYKLQEGTTLGADVLYGSGLRNGFANTGHQAAYTQVNTSAARDFDTAAFGKFNLRLSVLNLFDRGYELRDGSGIGVGAPQYGPRRSVYVALDKPFTF